MRTHTWSAVVVWYTVVHVIALAPKLPPVSRWLTMRFDVCVRAQLHSRIPHLPRLCLAAVLVVRPCGLMDKALVFGIKDCRFESCQDQGADEPQEVICR